MKSLKVSVLKRILRDVAQGYSISHFRDKRIYIRHLGLIDQVDIDDVKDQYYQNALKRGIPKKQEVLDKLKEEGDWTDAEENEIKRQEAFIEQLQKNKTQLVLKTQIDQQNKTIQETRTKINKLQEKKKSLLGVNAEDYSDKRANDYYIIKSFYSDKDLKKRVFEDESDFNELYADEVSIFVSAYNKTFLAFEELKKRLLAEGLFDKSKKKPMPKFPSTIGIVTSRTGAALRDMLIIFKRRAPQVKIIIRPALVQGSEAPNDIIAAIKDLTLQEEVNLIIIGRGGGSIEDLWPFNDEALAREIFKCSKPIISAVGHETDITISDMVADLRAPTPSAAAEIAINNILEISQSIENNLIRLRNLIYE